MAFTMRLPATIANKLRCWSFYAFGCYRGTGGRLKYVAEDWSEVRLELPLSWRTRNYVGTIFGGSLYSAVDPIYMLMLIQRLGPEYIVWDKAATIQFKKPGRETLHARFVVGDDELTTIRSALASRRAIDRTYSIDLVDDSGTACATIEKIIYIRRREQPPAKS
jgi:acyl-coenzyme A thioesterase PaaI-like protein